MAETTQTSPKANTATASTPASAKAAPASGLTLRAQVLQSRRLALRRGPVGAPHRRHQ